MTDKELEMRLKSELDAVSPSSAVRARIRAEMTGDNMDERKEITMTTNDASPARVRSHGRIAAAAIAAVLLVGGGAFILSRSSKVAKESSSLTSGTAHAAYIPESEGGEAPDTMGASDINFSDVFYPDEDSVFRKFGNGIISGTTEIYDIGRGRFVVKQALDNFENMSLRVYDSSLNTITASLTMSGNKGVVIRDDSIILTGVKADEIVTGVSWEIYDLDLNKKKLADDHYAAGIVDENGETVLSISCTDGTYKAEVNEDLGYRLNNLSFISFDKTGETAAVAYCDKEGLTSLAVINKDMFSVKNLDELYELEPYKEDNWQEHSAPPLIDGLLLSDDGSQIFMTVLAGDKYYLCREDITDIDHSVTTDDGLPEVVHIQNENENEQTYVFKEIDFEGGHNMFLRNGKLYLFETEFPTYYILDTENGAEACSLPKTVLDSDEYQYEIYNMSKSGEYTLRMTGSDNGDTLLEVFRTEDMSLVWSDTLEDVSLMFNSDNRNTLFDENTGDLELCFTSSDEDNMELGVYRRNIFGDSAEDTQPDYSEADIPEGLAVTTTVSAEPTEELPEYEEITTAMETTTVTAVIPDDELYGE